MDDVEEVIFHEGTSLYEIAPKARFTPRFTVFNSVINDILNIYCSRNSVAYKTLSPGMLSYYATAMVCLRILVIKKSNHDFLSAEERAIVDLVEDHDFNIPEPLSLYLKQFGNITAATQRRLYPEFPRFPVTDHGSVWAKQIDCGSHELFETIPCLGVAASVICEEISNPTADFQPPVVPKNTSATENLLGFIAFANPAKGDHAITSVLRSAGVTKDSVNPSIPNTDFNIEVLVEISHVIARQGVFKVISTNFRSQTSDGNLSQLVKMVPSPPLSAKTNVISELQPLSLAKVPSRVIESAFFYVPNIVREGGIGNDEYLGWSCLRNTYPTQPVVYQRWHDNRNALRMFPPEYDCNVFTAYTQNAGCCRRRFFEGLTPSH